LEPEYNIERTVGKVLHDFWKCEEWSAKNAERARQEMLRRWRDPSARKNMLRIASDAASLPARREKASKLMSERWNDPVFVAAAKIRSSEEMKKRFACPAYRDRHSEIRSRHMKEQRKDAAFNAICNEASSRRNK